MWSVSWWWWTTAAVTAAFGVYGLYRYWSYRKRGGSLQMVALQTAGWIVQKTLFASCEGLRAIEVVLEDASGHDLVATIERPSRRLDGTISDYVKLQLPQNLQEMRIRSARFEICISGQRHIVRFSNDSLMSYVRAILDAAANVETLEDETVTGMPTKATLKWYVSHCRRGRQRSYTI